MGHMVCEPILASLFLTGNQRQKYMMIHSKFSRSDGPKILASSSVLIALASFSQEA